VPFPLHGLARHKAPLRPPSRRSWVAVTLLVSLTALPMLVVVLAGRAALDKSAPNPPARADSPPAVVIDPGRPDEPSKQPDEAAAPQLSTNSSRSTPQSVPEAASLSSAPPDRRESRPCPPSSGPDAGFAPSSDSGSAAGPSASRSGSGTSGAPATGSPTDSAGARGSDGPAGSGGSPGSGGPGSGGPANPSGPSISGGDAPGAGFLDRVWRELGLVGP
jgi:hypothetical protein